MLKIEIISVGRPKSSWIREGVEHYRKLAGKYAAITMTTVKEAESARARESQVMLVEGERLLEQLDEDAYSIALTDGGESTSSVQLSRLIEKKKKDYSKIQFFIGGPFGLDPAVLAAVDTQLSLSKMTFPHELVQVILLEQLYRALSIAAGGKYHK